METENGYLVEKPSIHMVSKTFCHIQENHTSPGSCWPVWTDGPAARLLCLRIEILTARHTEARA